MPDLETQSLENPIIAVDAGPFDTRAGIVVGAHGIQGTIKVKPITPTSSRLFNPAVFDKKELTLWLGADRTHGKLVNVLSAKRQEPKDVYLLHLKDVSDRDTAESLIGQSFYGQSDLRADLSEDEYFIEDLIGLSVVDRAGKDLGHVVAVHSGVANDVYETNDGLLIPAVKAFVDSVNLTARKITVVDAATLIIE